jgi:hypothetical protein
MNVPAERRQATRSGPSGKAVRANPRRAPSTRSAGEGESARPTTSVTGRFGGTRCAIAELTMGRTSKSPAASVVRLIVYLFGA